MVMFKVWLLMPIPKFVSTESICCTYFISMKSYQDDPRDVFLFGGARLAVSIFALHEVQHKRATFKYLTLMHGLRTTIGQCASKLPQRSPEVLVEAGLR